MFCKPSMFSQRVPLVIFAVLIIVHSLLASVVVIEGTGKTVADAEANAQKIGIRQELEKILTPKRYKENQERIESIFIMNYQSYTFSRKVLESIDEFGVVKARVRVEPNHKRIMDVLKEEGFLPKSAGKPRIMVLLDERVNGQPAFEKSAAFALEQELTQRGFTVIEAEQMNQIKQQEQAANELATMGFRSGADLILKGQVSVGKGQLQTIYGISQYNVPVQMNVRVVRADNAEVVMTRSKSLKKSATDEFSAGQIGLTFGGKEVGTSVAKQLTKVWEKELVAPKMIEFMATGSNFTAVEKALENNSNIISSSLRYLEDNVALYDVHMIGSVQDLRDEVSKIPGWTISLVTKNRVGIRSNTLAKKQVVFEYAEPEISISSFAVADIFPSRGRFYEDNSIASIAVDLKQGTTVKDMKVSVMVPGMMKFASEKKIKMLTGGTTTVEMPLILNSDGLIENSDTRKINAKATISFYQNGTLVTRDLSVPVTVHDANAMDWAEPASIASFVTYRNPTVDKFARAAVVSVDKTGFNDQFEEALAIFTTLKKYGITYVKDPTPAGDARVLDKVQYPLQTLEKKSGDCDDSSVLIASLLSAVGIDVAFISYPDHVLIMFDTGIYKKNRHRLGIDQNSVVIHKDRCWIPVETTLLKRDFYEAWRTAAKEYHQALSDGENIAINELSSAWKLFPAANYNTINNDIVAPNAEGEIKMAIDNISKTLAGEISREITRLEGNPGLPLKEQNRLGILYARRGDYAKAVSYFTEISNGTSLPILANNLGCALILSGDEKSALVEIEKSIALKKTPPALVNKALAHYLMSNTPDGVENFVAAMIEANNALPQGISLATMLGLDLADGTGDRASEHTAEKPQTIDKRRLQEIMKKRVLGRNLSKEAKEKGVTANVNVMPFGGVRGADPTQIATIVDLLFWME